MTFTARIVRKGNMSRLIDRITRAFRSPKDVVKVGFPAGQADGDVVARAVWNEFGTSRGIPERPALRNALQNNETKYRQRIRSDARKILLGELMVTTALGRLGTVAAGDMQREIAALQSPPNAPETIRRKGSSNPLVDTTEMMGAVTYKLDKR